MFMNCPHCRDLVATDSRTRLPPLMCPRCGGLLRKPVEDEPKPDDPPFPGGLSLASFLRGNEENPAAAPADVDVDVEVEVEVEADQAAAEPATATVDAIGDSAAISGEDGNGDPVAEDAYDAPTVAAVDALDALEPAIEAELQAVLEPAMAENTPIAEAATIVAPAPEPGPNFIRQPASVPVSRRTAAWQWAVLLLLALVLLLQVLIADRARLAADPGWRPVVTGLCNTLGCSVPAWHQPGAFTMLSRDVRPLAGRPGALQVQATFRNDAGWAQPWPVLQVSLSDADGRVLGVRGFTPADYRGASSGATELAPGQSASVSLQIQEPSPQVAAFSFDFR